jgi:hypothetical protein
VAPARREAADAASTTEWPGGPKKESAAAAARRSRRGRRSRRRSRSRRGKVVFVCFSNSAVICTQFVFFRFLVFLCALCICSLLIVSCRVCSFACCSCTLSGAALCKFVGWKGCLAAQFCMKTYPAFRCTLHLHILSNKTAVRNYDPFINSRLKRNGNLYAVLNGGRNPTNHL